jgi:hypothetical protein
MRRRSVSAQNLLMLQPPAGRVAVAVDMARATPRDSLLTATLCPKGRWLEPVASPPFSRSVTLAVRLVPLPAGGSPSPSTSPKTSWSGPCCEHGHVLPPPERCRVPLLVRTPRCWR